MIPSKSGIVSFRAPFSAKKTTSDSKVTFLKAWPRHSLKKRRANPAVTFIQFLGICRALKIAPTPPTLSKMKKNGQFPRRQTNFKLLRVFYSGKVFRLNKDGIWFCLFAESFHFFLCGVVKGSNFSLCSEIWHRMVAKCERKAKSEKSSNFNSEGEPTNHQ